jgi:Protein of unknown function (DUF1761)
VKIAAASYLNKEEKLDILEFLFRAKKKEVYMHVEINYLAVAVAALIYFASGALWYSPAFLGTQWMSAAGLDDEKIKEVKKEA